MKMIEGGNQSGFSGQQHAISEHVTSHIANTDYRKRLVLDILAQFPEMALD